MYRLIWTIRAFFYKAIFKHFGFPSYLGKPTFLLGTKSIIIKKNVKIFPGLRMEVHNKGGILIEDDVGIAQNVQITCSEEDLIISKGTVILAYSFITNIDHSYEDINQSVLKQKMIVKKTFIGERCFIGIGSSIQAGTVLGKHCIVGANSVVRGTFPDYSVIVGVPAKIVKRYNSQKQLWERTDKSGNFLS